MSKNKDYIDTMSTKIQSKLKAKAESIAEQLAPAIQAGDASDVSNEVWYEIIRRNWNDPNWRMSQADARGEVKFVQDALKAHGLNPSLLRFNADVIIQKLSQWNVDATADHAKWLAEYAKEHNVFQPPEETPQV